MALWLDALADRAIVTTALVVALYGTISMIVAANLIHLARRRRARGRPFTGRVSVLVPARNEERNLARLLPSLLQQEGVDFEVIVYDDASEDGTAGVVARHASARVQLIRGSGPPRGWIGKVHALYAASRVATGDVLLFLDADTKFTGPRALLRLAQGFAALPERSVLTAFPRFRGGAALIVSAVPYGILAFLPLPLARFGGGALAALNGQCWLIGRSDYFAHEPHLHHPNEVLEDVKIGRYLAGRGVVPRFADLSDDLEVWMYPDLATARMGFRKNAYRGAGGAVLPFLAFFGFFALVHLAIPALSLGFALWIVAIKGVTDRFSRMPIWVSALAPVTFLLVSAILLDSAVANLRGTATWKGRVVGVVPS